MKTFGILLTVVASLIVDIESVLLSMIEQRSKAIHIRFPRENGYFNLRLSLSEDLLPACYYGNYQTVKLLLEETHRMESKKVKETDYGNLFSYFTETFLMDIHMSKVEHHSISSLPDQEYSCLHLAIIGNHVNIVKLLLHYYYINHDDNENAHDGQDNLLKGKVNLKQTIIAIAMPSGKNSLHLAAEYGRVEIVEILVKEFYQNYELKKDKGSHTSPPSHYDFGNLEKFSLYDFVHEGTILRIQIAQPYGEMYNHEESNVYLTVYEDYPLIIG